jgi:hypothetical protein
LKTKIFTLFLLLNATGVFSQNIDILRNFNGDFENGITFWRFFEVPSNIGSRYELTPDAVSGNQAIKIIYVAADATITDRGFDNWSARVPVMSGSQYSLRTFVKSDNTSGLIVNIVLGFFDNSGSVIPSQNSKSVALTNVYAEQNLTATAPSNAASCWIAFRMYDTSGKRVAGTMYIDNVSLTGPSTMLSPRIMETSMPPGDVPVASVNVLDAPYNAKNDGSADATPAFQAAINRASTAGGAVVFVPAGRYRFDGNLTLTETVILRGEWENPDSSNGFMGTLLMPYAGKGSETGEPFIKINRGAGIRNVSIWYPEQTVPSVTPYPWTIHCNPDGSAGSGDNASVVNVTLFNSYNGIKIGPNGNELHYIRNVYGTPLNQGIWLSQTTDIGRIENVHFEPKYWSRSGLAGSPGETSILTSLSNGAIGIIMGRSDWEYIYDVSLVGYQTGVQIIKYLDTGPNGVIYGLRIEKSKIGLDLVNVSSIGWAITNTSIKTEGINSACIRAGDAFNSIVQFNTCSFGGDPGSAVLFTAGATGRLSFQNCTFDKWGQSGDAPAIDCIQGSLSLMGNTFNLDKTHVRLGTNVSNAQLLDNTFPAGLKIDNKSSGEIIISQEPLNLTRQNIPAHLYAIENPPVKASLFNVCDYGAVPDGKTDNSAAFQNALSAAGLNGGTVYIPSGMYRISTHLEVPEGVELRGIWDVPHHTINRGSILLAYEGKGNGDGTPFITLKKGSGVRGFTIWYPEQTTQDFFAYPWSVQATGENCWIRDVTLGNPYQGVDLATYPSTGHIISYLAGSPLKTGISVSRSTGDGWIENVQFNPHYWMRSSGYPQASQPDNAVLISKQQSQMDAFVISTATREHILGTFVFAARRGFYLAPDEGTSNVDVFLHGTDAGSEGVSLESRKGSKIRFINAQLVLLGSSQNGIVYSNTGFSADAQFFNTVSWGGSGPTANINGTGNVLIQQIHTKNGAFFLNNGITRIENIALTAVRNPQYIIGSGVGGLKMFGSYSSNKLQKEDYSNNKSLVELDYYYNLNLKGDKISTGWETADLKNTWENTLFGNKDVTVTGNEVFQCKATLTESAHSGSGTLKVAGTKLNGSSPCYKVLDLKIPVLNSTTLTYWLKPVDESGRTGNIDILFTDGTRLKDYNPIASDALTLNSPRGKTGEWIQVKCSIGKYAAGKIIQTIIAGAELVSGDNFSFLIDDLLIEGVVGVDKIFSEDKGLLLYQNFPNPFYEFTTIPYELDKSGYVTLKVYDITGKGISLSGEQHQLPGKYQIQWIPKSSDPGIYFYEIDFVSDSGQRTIIRRKMILNR